MLVLMRRKFNLRILPCVSRHLFFRLRFRVKPMSRETGQLVVTPPSPLDGWGWKPSIGDQFHDDFIEIRPGSSVHSTSVG